MFKNVPYVETKCGKNASETFPEQFRDYLI